MPFRLAVSALAVVVGALLTGCAGTIQVDADTEAARIADHVLPLALDDAAATSAASDPNERAAAVADWLADPGPSVMDGQRSTTWVVRGLDGDQLRVDLYTRVESGSFLPPDQGEDAWGVACRTYVVTERVLVVQRTCPDDTPAEP